MYTAERKGTMVTVDACGLSCPEPVIQLKKVLDSNEIDLMVDNQTSVEACSRFARGKGYDVQVEKGGGVYTLKLRKGSI